MEIRALRQDEWEVSAPALVRILIEAVQAGASLGFMQNLGAEIALAFWQGAFEKIESGEVVIFAAFSGKVLIATTTLRLTTPSNQPHRGEICKVIVAPSHQGLGVGKALMKAAEIAAVEAGKNLLTLDTESESGAEFFYLSLGWLKVGEIPRYALSPSGDLHPTSIFYKEFNQS